MGEAGVRGGYGVEGFVSGARGRARRASWVPAATEWFSLALGAVLAACGGAGGGGTDAGATDTGSTDTGVDAGAPRDGAAGDAVSDASNDVASDAGNDVASDAGNDVESDAASDAGNDAASDASTDTGNDGGGGVPDPNADGPYTYAEVDDTIASVTGGDSNVPVHCAYPASGPGAGPYPVVVVAHGFQLPASQYYGYVRRLATFGYVALAVDYPASVFSPNNPANARDLLAGLDWAAGRSEFQADANNAGMTGHSLGGKLALLAATMDARVKASIVLDPVDGGANGCSPPNCVDVSALMPNLQIPTGFLGETTDATGSFMPCAPEADNYATFYAQANPPSFAVTVIGANHMSFLDDPSTCGFVCSFCQPASAPDAQVHAMAQAYVAAFYERYLRGNTAYDAYLTGLVARTRYVATGQATLQSK